MSKTAIIGFGCAGYIAAKTLRKYDKEMEIDVFSDTDLPPYNPMLTTYYLSGKIGWDRLFPFGRLDDICSSLNISMHTNAAVTQLQPRERTIATASGCFGPYDDIIICSGAVPVLPDNAKGLANVFAMRTIADVRAMDSYLDTHKPRTALVIGAQMVGIKVAEMLSKRGLEVTLAGRSGQVFPRSAFPDIAQLIHGRIADHNICQMYGAALSDMRDMDGSLVCTFNGSDILHADMCCICTGIKANIPFITEPQIISKSGIPVDLHMQTDLPHILACGDCCTTFDVQTKDYSAIGLWMNSYDQGKIAALNILGGAETYQGNLIHNISHFMDMDFISIGNSKDQGEHIRYSAPDGSWHVEMTVNESGELKCINILDNVGMSGPLKAFAINTFTGQEEQLSDVARMRLLSCGLPEEVIELFCRKVG